MYRLPPIAMTTHETPSAHPQARRIESALDALHGVLEHWDEDDVHRYPEGMPSFDEFLSDIASKLRAIEWECDELARHCTTCGSEIVATINDSHFNEGECGLCEYERYRSQPTFVEATTNALRELQCPDGDDAECGALAQLRDALAKAQRITR